MNVGVRKAAFSFLAGIITVPAFAGTASEQAGTIVEGPCGSLYGAKACTSYRIRSGKVAAFSLSVPLAALERAPVNAPAEWPPRPEVNVSFPAVVEQQTGFRYANIYWEPQGHPPAVYMVPHFDFHFYFISERKVQEIDCKDTREPQSLPSGYTLPDVSVPQIGELVGLCVPEMGMHAMPDTDVKRKTPWEASLLIGYYGGEPIFLEPMITRALLLQKRSFSLAVPKIEQTPHVRYPSEFRAIYVPASKTYYFTFSY